MSSELAPEGSPPGFSNLQILGTLAEDLEEWRENWLRDDNPLRDEETEILIDANGSPSMWCTKEVRDMFASSNFAQIDALKKKVMGNVEAVDENIRTKGENAFVRVQDRVTGKQFYMSYSSKASLWVYNYKTETQVTQNEKGEEDVKFTNYIQVGKYSTDGGSVFATNWILTDSKKVSWLVVSGFIAKMVETVLKMGAKFIARKVLQDMTQFASKNGIKALVKYGTKPISYFFRGCIGIFVYLGLEEIWEWANRKYTVNLSFYNWSTTHELQISDCYLDNVRMAGEEEKLENRCEIYVPKMKEGGSDEMPPGFSKLIVIDTVCHYVTYIFENNDTFFEGCGIAMKVEIDEKASNKGFYYAFECPRFGSNVQKADANLNGYPNSKAYYDNAKWNANPLKFSLNTQGIPVSVTLDALNGNNSNYRAVVSFNY